MVEPHIIQKRDKILESMLFYIARDPFLNKNLILHGGGALHFVYSSPRYSNDLDFVVPNFREDKDRLIKKFSDDLKHEETIRFKNLKLDKDFLRTKYFLENDKEVGSIDIVSQKANKIKKIEGKYSPLLVEFPSEIYADKIISLLGRLNERGSIKGSDLFDLDYITKNFDIPTDEEITQKAMDYFFNGFNERVKNKLIDHINNPKNRWEIIKNLKRTLSPDYFKEQDFDQEFFNRICDYLRLIKI